MTRIANGNRPYENWNVHYNNSYDRLTVPFKNFFLNPNPQLLLSKLSQHVKPASIINSSSNGIEYYFYNSMVFSAHLGFGLINLKDVTNKTLFDGGLININSILPIKVINGKDTLSQKITNYFDLDIDINNKPITSQVSIPSANRVFDHFFIENDTDLSMNSYTLFSTNKFHFELNRKKLNVKKGGWIISNASIKISNGITNTNTEEGLVICSLNGDIIINTSEPIHASLIALSGKLKKTCDTPFTVKGNICVKAIDKSIFNTPVKRNFTCSIHNNNCWENQLQYADWLNYPYTDQGKYEKMYRIVVSPKNLFLKIKGI